MRLAPYPREVTISEHYSLHRNRRPQNRRSTPSCREIRGVLWTQGRWLKLAKVVTVLYLSRLDSYQTRDLLRRLSCKQTHEICMETQSIIV